VDIYFDRQLPVFPKMTVKNKDVQIFFMIPPFERDVKQKFENKNLVIRGVSGVRGVLLL